MSLDIYSRVRFVLLHDVILWFVLKANVLKIWSSNVRKYDASLPMLPILPVFTRQEKVERGYLPKGNILKGILTDPLLSATRHNSSLCRWSQQLEESD